MNKTESVYLDAIRVLAALLVLASHVGMLAPGLLPAFGHGHDAVIIFFVLSGYVIAYVTDQRENDPRDYLLSRFARLYSVALPALLLTVVADFIGLRADAAVYAPYAGDWPVIRLLSAFFFSSELWFLSIQPLSNGPYWSLCYEFWYYLIFAAWTFLHGRSRLIVLVLLMLLIGPKMLLLFPIWCAGVGLYRLGQGKPMPVAAGVLLFFSSIAAFWLCNHFAVYAAVDRFMQGVFSSKQLELLAYSNTFLMDYLIGLLVVMNLLGLRACSGAFRIPESLAQGIKWLASFTLSIYLFHFPLLKLFLALRNGLQLDVLGDAGALGLTFAAILLLGRYTEHRKQVFRRVFEILFRRLPAWR